MTFVKICGVRREADADLCCALGVDAIGVNLVPASSRFAGEDLAAKLGAHIADRALVVWVIDARPPSHLAKLLAQFPRSLVQRCDPAWPWPADLARDRRIDVVRLAQAEDVATAVAAPARFVISDALGALGGSGKRADWPLTKHLAAQRAGVLVAGGLTPDNVRDAIAATGASGVDVAGGVESAPGIKDAAKIRRFVEAARG